MKKWIMLAFTLVLTLAALPAYHAKAAVTGQYTNPLMNGADPTIVRGDDGYFYSGFGTDNNIYIKRSETLLGLSTADSHLVWKNPRSGDPDNNKNYYVWGPYIYRIDGAWYIYFSSSTENDFGYGHPSCYVLENTSSDPFEGTWELKGENSNVDDFDGNESKKAGLMNTESYGLACGIVTIAGEKYFTYTKYEYYKNEPGNTKFNECPTIVKMENPWTLTGEECTVARPGYDWELHGDNVDEGAAVVEHDGKVYFAYSASSFTNDNYCVGLSVCDLNACDENTKLSDYVMNEDNWKKSTTPILSRSDENSSFGPGSPLFVKSPDGTEDWLIYHAGPIGGQTSTDRRVRAQKINWTDDGQINLGIPSNPNTVLDLPSGEVKTDVYEAENADYENVTKKLFNNTAKASGSGYMKYDQGNGYVEFNVNMSEDGTYALAFRYNNMGENVKGKVSVNGKDAGTLAFGKNGKYDVDLDSCKLYNVSLKKGDNTIRLTVDEKTELALDAMVVTKTVLYDAKEAELSNGAKQEGDYVGGMYGDDATITFTVDVPDNGYYAVDLCYADNHAPELKKYATIYVNGEKAATSALFPTGGWDVSGNRIDNLYLKKGKNTIAYVNHKENGENTADVNYYSIAISEAVTNTYCPEKDSTFTVNAESEAIYDVTFTYDSEKAGSANVIVNGGDGKKVSIASGDNQTATVAVKLNAGENTLKFDGATATSIYLSRRTPWSYQAENAELKGVQQVNDHLYYDGTGFVGGFESAGNSVKFTTNVAYSGTHTVNLRYSSVADEDRTISLYINGQKVKQITLEPTESWDEWKENKEEVYLRAGKNTVEYRVDEEDTGRLNIDEIIVDKYATGATTAEVAKLISGEVYVIKDKNSSLSADIDAYSPDAGREIHLWYYLGNNNQKWKLVDLGNGYWAFQGTYGSKRFSVKADQIDGEDCYTAVTAEVDEKDHAQQWKLERVGNYYKFINRKASEEADQEIVLSVYKDSKTAGAKLYLAPYDSKDSQLFSVDGGTRLENTEVQEIENEQSADDYASNGSQYELGDPIIPEEYDPSEPVKDGNALRYEAENAALENGAAKATNHTGYSGDAFVEGMWNGDASVTFKINVETAGNYTLALGYSNGYAENESNRAAATYLNGNLVTPTPLPSTGFNNWDSWGESEFQLDLQAGVNTIVFRNRKEDADGLQGDVNYDYLDVSKYPNTVAADETEYVPLEDKAGKRYEAENAELSGSGVESEHKGFSGDGYVGKMYNGNAKISFQVAVEEAGEYTVQLRYANGHGDDVEDKYAAVFVNGKYVEALELPKTGSWGEWKTTEPMKLKLNAGVSTIAFVNSSYNTGHAADVNYDYMDLILKQEAEPVEYKVTIQNGTATPDTAPEGTEVTIQANEAEEGMMFDKWIVESGEVTLEDPASAETTFVMGTSDVVVSATYKEIPSYEIIEGENLSVVIGEPVVFVSNADFGNFKEVQIDGETLEADQYDVEAYAVEDRTDLTKVTLKESYVEGLSLGNHTITIVSEDGFASTDFTIKGNTSYEIIDGENLSVAKGEAAVFVSNADISIFKEVQVDGETVEADQYDVEDQEGSTKVTLKESYVEGLGLGKHTITIVSEDGFASAEFEVLRAEVEATIKVSPEAAEVEKGGTFQFNAEVTELDDESVTWSIEGAKSENTVISSEGLLTIGEDETATELTVTATANGDNTLSAAAKVTIKEAAEPEEPSEPSEPEEPSEPTKPGDETKPGEPSEPTKPGDNTKPEKPSEPGKPTDYNKPQTPSGSGNTTNSVPKTGDSNGNLWVYVMMIVASVGVFGTVVYKRRKENVRF
ncbi:CBM35 domain-containing protein [Roseburia hominis]